MSAFAVLHIDDDPNDAFFVQRAFLKANLGVTVFHVPDGVKAMDYLSGAGAYADRAHFPLPSVVLLDLKIPLLDGFELLSWARNQAPLRRLPIYILSSSDHVRDRTRARELGADEFFVKTATFPDVIEKVRSLLPASASAAAARLRTV